MDLIYGFIGAIAIVAVAVGVFFLYKKQKDKEYKKKKEEEKKEAEQKLIEQQAKAQAEAEQKKKAEEEQQRKIEEELAKKEWTLWDETEKPLDWFFGDSARAVYSECIANAKDMWVSMLEEARDSLNSPKATEIDGISSVFYYACNELWHKRSWLIVFYTEFMKAKYPNLSLSIKNRGYMNPLFWLMKAADLRRSDDKSQLLIAYPDCLQEDKNPMLYYLSRSLKEVFGYASSGMYSYLGPDVIMKYIYNALKAGVDVSKEEWMYDESFFFTPMKQLKSDFTIAEQIKAAVKHPEYLSSLI